MPLRRYLTAIALTVLVLAGCGGDDDSDDDRAGGSTDAEATTQAPPSTDTSGTETDEREPDETTTSESGGDGPTDTSEGGAGRGGGGSQGSDTDTPADDGAARPGRPLTGRRLIRCLRRTTNLRGDPRLRVQARCLGTTASRLRRLIRRNCRQATKTPAAYRNCVRIGTGGG